MPTCCISDIYIKPYKTHLTITIICSYSYHIMWLLASRVIMFNVNFFFFFFALAAVPPLVSQRLMQFKQRKTKGTLQCTAVVTTVNIFKLAELTHILVCPLAIFTPEQQHVFTVWQKVGYLCSQMMNDTNGI